MVQASDFDAGAMENWVRRVSICDEIRGAERAFQGLITGRTTAFCLDPKKSGINAQKRVATVQSHEVRSRGIPARI